MSDLEQLATYPEAPEQIKPVGLAMILDGEGNILEMLHVEIAESPLGGPMNWGPARQTEITPSMPAGATRFKIELPSGCWETPLRPGLVGKPIVVGTHSPGTMITPGFTRCN